MSVCKPWLWPYAPSTRRPLDHIWARPGQAEAAVVYGFSRVRGQVIATFHLMLAVTHPLQDILGINWTFMCVTYIMRGACMRMRLESAGAQSGCRMSLADM